MRIVHRHAICGPDAGKDATLQVRLIAGLLLSPVRGAMACTRFTVASMLGLIAAESCCWVWDATLRPSLIGAVHEGCRLFPTVSAGNCGAAWQGTGSCSCHPYTYS